MQRIRISAFILLALAMFVASCGSSSKSSTPDSSSGPVHGAGSVPIGPAITIETSGSMFMFTTKPVKAGAKVTVKNTTDVQHTVSADTTAGGFDLTVDPGTTMTFTAPAMPGAYKFHCNIHTYMTSTLTVT